MASVDAFRAVLPWFLAVAVVASLAGPGAAAAPRAVQPTEAFETTPAPLANHARPTDTNESTDGRTSTDANGSATDGDAGRTSEPAPGDPPPHHENPERVNEEGNLDDVQSWLSHRMGRALVGCAKQTENGAYSCAQLRNKYPAKAERFATVAQRTESEDDDNASRVLGETRRDQLAFTDSVRNFRRTYARYEQARRDGNEGRARELSRRLLGQATEVERTADPLLVNYDVVTGNTSTNLGPAAESVSEVRADISRKAAEVREAEFVETRLEVRTNAETASFASPARVEGRLTTRNGTPVAERRLQFRVGQQVVTASSDADGRFSFPYRPTTDRVGDRTLNATYVPQNDSVYTGSNDTLAVTVDQTAASVTVRRTPDVAGFAESVDVNGTVTAANRGVGDVPVVIEVGGERVGTTRTNANGSYAASFEVPASVESGDRRAVAALPLRGRAIAPTEATAPIRIRSTPTDLSLTAATTEDGAVNVSGQLVAGETPVRDETVALSANGETIARTRTDANGQFALQADLFSETDGEVTVVARYGPDGGNLEPSRAETTIDSGAPPRTDRLGGLLDAVADLLSTERGAVLVALALLAAVLYARDALRAAFRGVFGLDRSDRATGVSSPSERGIPGDPELSGARARLASGDTDGAIVLAYEAVHRRLSVGYGGDPSMTHWELLVACQRPLSDDRTDDLRRLTEAYERAMFAPQRSLEDTTADVLASASRLLDVPDAERESTAD